MAQLSTELLLLILEYASGATLKSIRLTCRSLCLLSTPILFRRIRFALHKDFLQPLVQVSRHEGLRRFVRELVYVTLYNYHPTSGCALESGYDSPFYLSHYLRTSLPFSLQRIYGDAFRKEIMPALLQLSNVTKVTLSNEILSAEYNDTKFLNFRIARRLCSSGRSSYDVDEGLWIFLNLLQGTHLQIQHFSTRPGQNIKGILLESFRLNDYPRDNCQSLVRNLRSIDLWIWQRNLPTTYRVRCLSNVHAMLTYAKQLEILRLRLPEYFWHNVLDGMTVGFLDSPSWSRLQHVTLRKVLSHDLMLVYNFLRLNQNLQTIELHISGKSKECLEESLTLIANLKHPPTTRLNMLRSKSYVINDDESDIDPDNDNVYGIELRYNEGDNIKGLFILRVFFDPNGSVVSALPFSKF